MFFFAFSGFSSQFIIAGKKSFCFTTGLKTAIRIPIIKTFELTTAFKLDELPTKIEVKKLPAIQPRLVNRSKTKIFFGGWGTLTFSIKTFSFVYYINFKPFL